MCSAVKAVKLGTDNKKPLLQSFMVVYLNKRDFLFLFCRMLGTLNRVSANKALKSWIYLDTSGKDVKKLKIN